MEPLVTLRDGSLRVGERMFFTETNWVIRRGEHWAIVGPTGSGKSLLASALCGQVPLWEVRSDTTSRRARSARGSRMAASSA